MGSGTALRSPDRGRSGRGAEPEIPPGSGVAACEIVVGGNDGDNEMGACLFNNPKYFLD